MKYKNGGFNILSWVFTQVVTHIAWTQGVTGYRNCIGYDQTHTQVTCYMGTKLHEKNHKGCFFMM